MVPPEPPELRSVLKPFQALPPQPCPLLDPHPTPVVQRTPVGGRSGVGRRTPLRGGWDAGETSEADGGFIPVPGPSTRQDSLGTGPGPQKPVPPSRTPDSSTRTGLLDPHPHRAS